MKHHVDRRLPRRLALAIVIAVGIGVSAHAQTPTPTPAAPTAAAPAPAAPKISGTTPPGATTPAPSTPSATTPPSATPPTPAPIPASPPSPKTPDAKAPAATPEGTPLAPGGKTQNNEIEPNGSPGIPENATTENVDVPARPIMMLKGQSTYDDAFKSIKASLDTVKAAMGKAGIKATGHPITIFSEPDDKGFKFQAAVPVEAKPDKTDIGDGVTFAMSPSGKAIKFQHRGAYDDIDSTYDVITAFLDAKGMQVDSPYIEEYLTDLTTSDDPNLQVDIYVFVK